MLQSNKQAIQNNTTIKIQVFIERFKNCYTIRESVGGWGWVGNLEGAGFNDKIIGIIEIP